MNRYNFYAIFRFDPSTNLLYTRYGTYINGLYYPQNTAIPRGLTFGGVNLYSYMGRDVAANWTPNALPNILPPTLTIVGFY